MAPFFCHYNFYQNRKIVPGFLSHYVNSVSRSTSTYIFCHMTYLNHLMVFFYACKYFTSINHALSNRISKDNHISCWSSIYWILIRYLMVLTDQADSSCFYFRMSWILMERHWFYFFCSLHLMQGLRSLKNWLLQKLSMKTFDQKFRFLIKNKYFSALIF